MGANKVTNLGICLASVMATRRSGRKKPQPDDSPGLSKESFQRIQLSCPVPWAGWARPDNSNRSAN
jgi:hypothetical protein